MRILLVTIEEKCPALFALRAEGYHPDVVVIDRNDIYGYGRAMHEYWQAGEPFINIEHDMAPWDGAVQALMHCTMPLCLYGYPRAASGSLGLIRFGEELIGQFPNVNERWPKTPWWMLEQAVLGKFKRNVQRHIHSPPVAHLSGWFRDTRDTY